MRVGFAGLGRMGNHMARNLVTAGYDVTVWNRTRHKAEQLAKETACAVAVTPKELADLSDVVITMLADDAASDGVHGGATGLFAGRRAHTLIEMGTMSPDHIRDLVQAAPENIKVVDAPVSGATKAAADRQLLIIAGCSASTAAPIMPLLEALGREVICLGRSGAGSVMKLAVNSLIHGINQTLAEAMTDGMGNARGVDGVCTKGQMRTVVFQRADGDDHQGALLPAGDEFLGAHPFVAGIKAVGVVLFFS